MKAIMGVLSALVLAGVAGCAGMSTASTPCESCNYGYVPVKKTSERRVWCVIDGKTVDCKKDPAGCPECAKAHKS